MKYTSFSWLIAAFTAICLANISEANNRITGQDLRDIIKQRAEVAGVDLEAIIAAEKVFYPCETELDITPKNDSWKTVEVLCPTPYPWKLNIRTEINTPEQVAEPKIAPARKVTKAPEPRPTLVKAEAQPPKPQKKRTLYSYIVLAEPVAKGTVLNENTAFDVKDYHYKVRGAFTDLDQLMGRKLKFSVPEGSPVLARYLTKNYVVEKNTILDIVLVRAGVKISGKGVALSSGQLGETIIVSNVDTGVKLKARIKNSHEAEIIAKQSN